MRQTRPDLRRAPADARAPFDTNSTKGSREADVKYIIAIIKPFRLDDVRAALTELGVQGMTVSDVRGFGRQKGHTEIYRGAEYTIDFLPKIKIEIAIADSLADRAVETIERTARTDKIGDGKVFVLELMAATRIRTGEAGEDAL